MNVLHEQYVQGLLLTDSRALIVMMVVFSEGEEPRLAIFSFFFLFLRKQFVSEERGFSSERRRRDGDD